MWCLCKHKSITEQGYFLCPLHALLPIGGVFPAVDDTTNDAESRAQPEEA